MNTTYSVFKQIDKIFIQFVYDVQQACTNLDAIVDSNYNIVITMEGKSLLIPCTELETRFNAYKGSALMYNEWVIRTVSYITKMVDKWYKSWH